MLELIRSLPMRTAEGAKTPQSWALARCSFCNKEVEVQRSHMKRNQSCGCAKNDLCAAVQTKHGEASRRRGGEKTNLYQRWCRIAYRCDNPNFEHYKHYGGKGIKLCEEWRDFGKFKEWAETNGYQEHLEIDREDANGDYEPGNCRWVTGTFNKRRTSRIKLTFEIAQEIRASRLRGAAVKALMAQFNVSRSTIYAVLNSAIWSNP